MYDTFEEMLDMAMKVEKQKMGKSTNKLQRNSSNTWGSKWSKIDEKKESKGSKPHGTESATKGKEAAQSSFRIVKVILTPQALVGRLNALNFWGKGILHLNVLTKELRLLKKNWGGSS
jgi:hypothetical protein